MRIIEKTTLLAALFTVSLGLSAQTFNAIYTYDANGNRLTAKVVYLSQSPTSPPAIVEGEINVDPETNLTIRIYPNPTQGDLRVELTGATPEEFNTSSNAIKVWDMQGRLLLCISPICSSNVVDLSRLSNGTYIMQLFFCGRMKDYKIVKN